MWDLSDLCTTLCISPKPGLREVRSCHLYVWLSCTVGYVGNAGIITWIGGYMASDCQPASGQMVTCQPLVALIVCQVTRLYPPCPEVYMCPPCLLSLP